MKIYKEEIKNDYGAELFAYETDITSKESLLKTSNSIENR